MDGTFRINDEKLYHPPLEHSNNLDMRIHKSILCEQSFDTLVMLACAGWNV